MLCCKGWCAMLCGLKYVGKKNPPTQPIFFLCSCKTKKKVGESTLRFWLPLHRKNWCSRREIAWVSWVALPSAGTVLGLISHWWWGSCRAGIFLAKSSFFTNLKQMHLKVFCPPNFIMCFRNSVTFRLPEAGNFRCKCKDDTGEWEQQELDIEIKWN